MHNPSDGLGQAYIIAIILTSLQHFIEVVSRRGAKAIDYDVSIS